MTNIKWRGVAAIFWILLLSCSDKMPEKVSNLPDEDLVSISYIEHDGIIGNPERGFYKHHLFSTSNSNVLNPKVIEHQRKNGVSLLLNIYYLNGFRDRLISG